LVKPRRNLRFKLGWQPLVPVRGRRRSCDSKHTTIKQKGDNMFKNILVPIDGSKLSVKAVKLAVKLAKSLDAKIIGFYATPGFGPAYYGDGYILRAPSVEAHAESMVKQARKCLSTVEVEAEVEKVPCKVIHAVSDSPYEAIIDAAKKNKCDLICMASHGRRGLSGLVLGSETHKVLIHSTIPVLVCR
jgi:nucleotide-binding universal stress UspA family protein